MAPCDGLLPTTHAVFSALCQRRNRRTQISKLGVRDLQTALGISEGQIRNEIEDLCTEGLLQRNEAGFHCLRICNHSLEMLCEQIDFKSPDALHTYEVLHTTDESYLAPPCPVSLRDPGAPGARGSGSLAATVKPGRIDSKNSSRSDRRSHFEKLNGTADQDIRPSHLKPVSAWNFYEFAQYFARETAWKLRVPPPNYPALARLLKDLYEAGTSKVEIHRMIQVFVTDYRGKSFRKPAWLVFYNRRQVLLEKARIAIRRRELAGV